MFDIDLPSYEELFAAADRVGAKYSTYQVECFEGDALIGTFQEPGPEAEIDHEGRTAKIRVQF